MNKESVWANFKDEDLIEIIDDTNFHSNPIGSIHTFYKKDLAFHSFYYYKDMWGECLILPSGDYIKRVDISPIKKYEKK